jgi:hypothetical protein
MRLNTYQKEAIVRAVMADVPLADDSTIQDEAQAAIVKAMSPAVRKLYRENPKALRTEHVSDIFDRSSRSLIVGDADVSQTLAPWREAIEKRDEARRKLKSVVNGCSTLKQLKTALPEFAKYMPTEEKPTANLPALANLAADFVKLGWPKGKSADATSSATSQTDV